MRHTTRPLLLVVGLTAILLGAQVPAGAEKPMSSPAVLASTATHIVRGTVVRVFTRVRRHGDSEDTNYLAEVHLAHVEKGEGIRLDRPLYARYWRKAWMGRGMPPTRSGGHWNLPKEGQAVRLYLARNAYDGFGTETKDGGYDVIGVNGIQPLTPEEVKAAEAASAPAVVLPFPEGWEGCWEGPLTIAKPGQADELTKLVVVIQATDDPDRWAFRIRHGKQDLRLYELIARDAAAGAYVIDEKNSIVLPATYLDGELFSSFSLDGKLVSARYRLDGDFLRFDLTQTALAPDETTGGDGVPKVGGHVVQVVQRAVLSR